MDEAKFSEAVAVARETYDTVMYWLQDPARSLANLTRREFDGEVNPAWIKEAEHPVRRSKLAADAVNQINPQLGVVAPTRRGPHPERDAARNIAALAAMWFLSEQLSLKPVTRPLNGIPESCAEGGSVCDAVGDAMGWTYKNAERVWTSRKQIFQRHPLSIMTLWAELPSATLLGIPPTRNK